LKERPSSATRLPFRVWRWRWSFSITRLRWVSFTATVASRSGVSCPNSLAAALRAETSFGKHDPPHPMPAFKNLDPMRPSSPMPLATLPMSAPASSHKVEISFMKLILAARKALAAYLIISALARSVLTKGTAVLGLGSSSVGKVCPMIGS
jgi:hypothetical protein